jgi:hypothetical protein
LVLVGAISVFGNKDFGLSDEVSVAVALGLSADTSNGGF